MRDHRRANKTDHFQVIRPDRELAPMQAFHALDMQRIGPDPGDIGPKRIQHLAEVLDMRLGSRVADDGRPAGGNRGHQDILRGGDGGLIQQDIGAFETFRLERKG